MFYIPTAILPYLFGLAAMIWVCKQGAQIFRKALADRKTQSARLTPFAKGGLSAINPLRWGQSATPATTLNTILLHTTPGMRLWAVGINIFVNSLLWVFVPGQIMPLGWPTVAASLSGLVACIGLYLYEARLDHDRLTIRKWGLFQKEYLWRDLTRIKDDKSCEYILHFGKSEVRMPKYLVGAEGFLRFIGETLAGNQARNARTA